MHLCVASVLVVVLSDHSWSAMLSCPGRGEVSRSVETKARRRKLHSRQGKIMSYDVLGWSSCLKWLRAIVILCARLAIGLSIVFEEDIQGLSARGARQRWTPAPTMLQPSQQPGGL